MKNSPLKIDLHLHTCYSEDSSITLKELLHYAEKKTLDGVAITDHNTIQGALKLIKNNHITIIPGLEVQTEGGHVLGLNLTTIIPSNLSISETVQRIHNAGGAAIIAHPGAFMKSTSQRITPNLNLDAVEAVNSAAFPFSLATHRGHRLAERLKLPQTGGSDAHHASEIGTAFTLVDADSNSDDIAEAIRKGAVTPCGKSITWTQRIRREAFRFTKKYGKH